MLRAIAKEFNDLNAIGTFANIEVPPQQSQGDLLSHRAEGKTSS